ncbi:hypothetical protein BH11VER1_BH11VER1_15210 [soil metagenome]
MPARFHIGMATTDDDAQLRDILRRTPMPGNVTVTLEREPSFFAGDVDAQNHTVIVARDSDSQVIALASRIEREAWIGGEIKTVAYLGDLRVLPEHRKSAGRIMISGFHEIQKLNTARPVASTYTAIFEDNTTARQVLVGGRAGLPEYVERGRLICPALLVRRNMKEPKASPGRIRRATKSDLSQLVAFLNERFRHRDFAPVHREEDFLRGNRWPGLRVEDFILAHDGGRLIGAIAIWDLRACRQIRVKNYTGWLKHLRGNISRAMKVLGWLPLPYPDELLPAAFASFLSAADDDLSIARQLLNHARYEASQRDIGFLFASLHEGDPLAPALNGWPGIHSTGRLFQVVFDGETPLSSGSQPHVEANFL